MNGMKTKTLQYPLRVPKASINETDRPSRGGGAAEVGLQKPTNRTPTRSRERSRGLYIPFRRCGRTANTGEKELGAVW